MSSMVSFWPMTSTRKTARLSSRRIAGGRDNASLIRSTETGNSAGTDVSCGSEGFWSGSVGFCGAACADAAGGAGVGADWRGIAVALVARSNDRRRVIAVFIALDDGAGVPASDQPSGRSLCLGFNIDARPVPLWDWGVRDCSGPEPADGRED